MSDSAPESVRNTRRLVSFVLPVFNEEQSLETLHRQIADVMGLGPDDYEYVFVDDGSVDDSFGVMSRLRESDSRVRVVRFRRNFGKAAAYAAGFDAARGDVIITLDTDLQDDPSEIPKFLDKIAEGFDMVIGWKHEGKGALNKSLPSRFFNKVVRSMTGIQLHDFNCPFKAYRKEVLREIQVYGELHRYIPVLARARGFTLAEIKVKNLPRKHGTSNYGLERYIRGMLDLLTVIFITRFAKRPMHLLALGGIVAGMLGSGILSFFAAMHFLYKLGFVADSSWNIHERPFLSLGVVLLIVGLQIFSSGLLAELIVIGHFSDRRDPGYSVKQLLDD